LRRATEASEAELQAAGADQQTLQVALAGQWPSSLSSNCRGLASSNCGVAREMSSLRQGVAGYLFGARWKAGRGTLS